MTEQEKADFIIQALIFFSSVDVSSDYGQELTEKALSIAEELKAKGGCLEDPEKVFISYDENAILEDGHLKKRIADLLRV